MSGRNRIQKTTRRKLEDLDDHLYLLRSHLYRFGEGEAHFKALSAELRVLICRSGKREGLLWRLTNELNVSDVLYLHLVGNVDMKHPMAQGLLFDIVNLSTLSRPKIIEVKV